MEVYLWVNSQGQGDQGIAATKEIAERELKASILKGHEDDPNPWEGWSWWEKDGEWCFGAANQMTVAEGSIQKFEVKMV